MIIYLSPAKVLNLKATSYNDLLVLDEDKTNHLYQISKAYSIPQLQSELKVSEAIATKVYQYYQDISKTYKPLELFQGAAYKALDYSSLSAREQSIADQMIVIGDAYYGLILGTHRIYPYRLDFTKPYNEIDLYAYWKADLLKHFNRPIVDLSSKEYQQLLPNAYDHPIKRVDLIKGTSLQRKQFRGLYARTIIQKKISQLENLEKMEISGYKLVKVEKHKLYYQID